MKNRIVISLLAGTLALGACNLDETPYGFYMSRKGEKVKELIMIVDGAATLKFVYLEGDMTLKAKIKWLSLSRNSSIKAVLMMSSGHLKMKCTAIS